MGDNEGVIGTKYDNGSVEVSGRKSESHQSQSVFGGRGKTVHSSRSQTDML